MTPPSPTLPCLSRRGRKPPLLPVLTRCNAGSAPDISGKGIVNPIGTILSVAMMCRYSLGLPKEAAAIEQAVRNVVDGGVRTKDLGGAAGTQETGDAIAAELIKILKN